MGFYFLVFFLYKIINDRHRQAPLLKFLPGTKKKTQLHLVTGQRHLLKIFLWLFTAAVVLAENSTDLFAKNPGTSLGIGQDNINLTVGCSPTRAYHWKLGFVPAAGAEGTGVIYSGLGVRWFFSQKNAFDFYWLAPDLNLSYFDIDQARGAGAALGTGAGLEYRISERFSITGDMGPYWIYLRNFDPSLSRQSWDWVISTSINFYLR